MKANTNLYIAVIGILSQADVAVIASVQNTSAIEVEVSPSQIFPCEPIMVWYNIRNLTNTDFSIQTRNPSVIAIKPEDGVGWQPFMPYDFSAPPPVKPPPVVLHAGEVKTELHLLNAQYNGKPIFNKPGNYLLKVTTPFGESDAVKVLVKSVTTNDENALKFILDHNLYLWFGFNQETAYFADYGHETRSDVARTNLIELLQQHPQSRYAQWAKVGIFWNRKNQAMKKIENNDSVKTQIALLSALELEIEKEAPSLPEPMQSLCWCGAGEIELRLGKGHHALGVFDHVSKASKYFSDRVSSTLKKPPHIIKAEKEK